MIVARCAIALLLCAACGGSVDTPTSEAPPTEPDAGRETSAAPRDAASEAAPTDTGVDAVTLDRLCCQTGQNLLACDPSAPWPCLASPTHGASCTDPMCAVGDACQGFTGMGTTVACGR